MRYSNEPLSLKFTVCYNIWLYFVCVLVFCMFYFRLCVQELNTDEDKKLSSSCENLLEATTSKVQMLSDDHNLSQFFSVPPSIIDC